MMRYHESMRRVVSVLALGIVLSGAASAQQRARDEEEADYFQKWLNEDVLYLISDEERAVFEKLTTPEEKEAFIEQFWFRRDPDPRTSDNEFKTEHYRRIAYANEHFPSGDPGWMTDRGRIYIIHGPPDEISSRPTGGSYARPVHEGGGVTSVYPYETWRYRRIEGVGDDVVLEFVDPTFTGEFRLAVHPWEKDAFLTSPGGATLAEQTGLATRADRPAFNPAAGGAGNNPQNMFRRLEDTPFHRYERVARVQAAPIVEYADLKELVTVDISYDDLPLDVRLDYFRLNEDQVLVPITVRVRNADLTFERQGQRHLAKLAVYGLVTSLSRRFVAEFEQDVTTSYPSANFEQGLQLSSVYQKVVVVEGRTRHKLDLVVKDLNGDKVGTLQRAIAPPKFEPGALSASSLIVSDYVQALDGLPDEEMFVIGDVKVLPNPDLEFTPAMPLGIYLHLYNAGLDQTTLAPSLEVTYQLYREGELLRQLTDGQGESTQFYSSQRVVLVRNLTLAGLDSGRYRIRVQVVDKTSGSRLELSETFRMIDSE